MQKNRKTTTVPQVALESGGLAVYGYAITQPFPFCLIYYQSAPLECQNKTRLIVFILYSSIFYKCWQISYEYLFLHFIFYSEQFRAMYSDLRLYSKFKSLAFKKISTRIHKYKMQCPILKIYSVVSSLTKIK